MVKLAKHQLAACGLCGQIDIFPKYAFLNIYSCTLKKHTNKSSTFHNYYIFMWLPNQRADISKEHFLCKCAAFCFFFLLSFSATDAQAHLLLSCLFCEPSLTEPCGLDRCFVYCSEIKKKRTGEKEAKKKTRWNEFPKKRSRRVGEKLPTLGIDSPLLPNSADGDWMQTELSNQISDETLKGCGNGRSGLKIHFVRNKGGRRSRTMEMTGEQEEPRLQQYVFANGHTCPMQL